jgi:GNAT superfamily N-acetyltransferase
MRANELAFVAKGVKESLRHQPPYAEQNNHKAYGTINPLINGLLARADVAVARDGSRALGFVVYSPSDTQLDVHYLYVRYGERRSGIGRALIGYALNRVPDDADLVYTFPTPRFADVAERYGFWCPAAEHEVQK